MFIKLTVRTGKIYAGSHPLKSRSSAIFSEHNSSLLSVLSAAFGRTYSHIYASICTYVQSHIHQNRTKQTHNTWVARNTATFHEIYRNILCVITRCKEKKNGLSLMLSCSDKMISAWVKPNNYAQAVTKCWLSLHLQKRLLVFMMLICRLPRLWNR